MKPEGHEPTREDRNGNPMTAAQMETQLRAEEELGVECEYTHYSRDEQIGFRNGYIRRFSRGAFDPFTAQRTSISGVDDTGHTVLKMGDV